MNSDTWVPRSRLAGASKHQRITRGLMTLFGWVAVLVSLFVGLPAHAQTTGVVTGVVTDSSTKAPLGDVVVTATSPALQGEQIVVTDASGLYRIPNLPPGDYQLRFDKETFKPYGRGGITLRSGTTIRVNIELLPEAIKAEEVVVVGSAPTVDVGSTQQGLNINRDFTSHVAVARPGAKGGAMRSFESVAIATPGAQGDDYGVGFSGTTSPENQYTIDGLSVGNTAYGIVGTPLSVEFLDNVDVITGGYMPEYGRAVGGYLAANSKSGSNEFHGSIWANITPGGLEGPRTEIKEEGQTIRTKTELRSIRDFGFDLGGPLVKDKLWFYTGFGVGVSTYKLTRTVNRIRLGADGQPVKDEDGFTQVDPIAGTERSYDAEERQLQYIGKLTWAINQDNKLTLSVLGTPKFSGGNGDYGLEDQRGVPEIRNINGTYDALAHRFIATSNDVALKYSSAFKNKTLLFDATLGWHHERSGQFLPSDGTEVGSQSGLGGVPSVAWRRSSDADGNPNPHSITDFENVDPAQCRGPNGEQLCPVFEYFSGGPDFMSDATLNRYQGKVMLTNLFQGLGHHVAKVGVDLEVMQYSIKAAYSGQERYAESDDGTVWTDERMYGHLTGPDQPVIVDYRTSDVSSTTIGGFLQDSWAIADKITLNAGIRYDSQFLYNDAGNLGMTLPNQFSPRVGLIFDPTQKGKSKLTASYAIYYESVPLDIADRALTGDAGLVSRHDATICNPNDRNQWKTTCRDDAGRVDFGSGTNPNRLWRVTGGSTTPVDPDLKPQSSSEFALGGEYEIINDGRLGVTYQKRWMNNVIEDMSRDEAETYFIGNPGQGIAADFPEATRDYDAVTFFFSKAFKNQWLAQLSYTVSSLRGNWAGLYRPETAQLDPNINSDFDLKVLTVNRQGPLPGDSTHQIKLFGAKEISLPKSMAIDLGLTFIGDSGGPTNYLGAHQIYGTNEVFILPRGAGERLPWVFRIDPHVGWAYKFGKDSELKLTMDIFNVFNFQAVTAVDETYTNSTVTPIVDGTKDDLKAGKLTNDDGTPFDATNKNPNFGKPLAYQAPRQFRFGARVSF